MSQPVPAGAGSPIKNLSTMKNLLLGLCIVGLTFACKSNDSNYNVDDAQGAQLSADCESECSSTKSECCDEAAAECSGAKAECSGEAAAECSGAKAECSGEAAAECSGDAPAECSGAKPEGAVCPMSGKPIN